MRLDGAARHIELTSDFVVVAALQQQVHDLPFPGSELDLGIFHLAVPFFGAIWVASQHLGDLYRPTSGQLGHPRSTHPSRVSSTESLFNGYLAVT